MTVKRMDNVLIVVDDLEAVKAFFIELGLELEGQTTVEGPSVGSLVGLGDVRATLAMLRTPDGQGIELDKFHTPNAVRFGPVDAPVNALGLRRIMLPSMTSMLSMRGCRPMAQNSLARCSTRNRTGSPIFVGLRASSSGLPSNSVKGGRLARTKITALAGSHLTPCMPAYDPQYSRDSRNFIPFIVPPNASPFYVYRARQ